MSKGRRMSNEGQTENKKSKPIFIILALVYLVITIIFCVSIIRMDMLPGKYLTIFIIIEVILTLLVLIGLAKKHKTLKLNILCLILAIILSSGYIYATNYINATINFLGTMFTNVSETEEYYVVVRNDNNYNELEDLAGEELSAFRIEENIITELKEQINVEIQDDNSLIKVGSDLIDNATEGIFVSSSQYSILREEIDDFETNTKIIYTLKHEIKSKVDIEDENSKYTIDNGVFNVYISGIDTSGSISNVARSDANILATINTKTHEVLITSIPRDYYVTLYSKGAKDKLTHSGIYGINETVSTVEELLDTDINYYIRVNFTTLIKLVDTLGGVDVYSEYDFSTGGYHFNKGYNHVNGAQALAFSRERHSFGSGDNQRIKNQQHVIEAVINKVLNSTTILTKYTSILESLEGSFQTNIEQNDISNLVKEQLDNMESWTIDNYSLTGTGSSSATYSMGSQKLYVMLPNESSVEEAKNNIQELLGE